MPNSSGIWNLKEQVQAIAAGRWTGLPLPELYAWGYNANGRLGDGTVINRSSPVQIGTLTNWYQVSAGGSHSTAITTDGKLWAWGNNTFGQLGQNDVIPRSSPVQVGALTDWAQVSAGYTNFVAAVKSNGTLWTWGDDDGGNLGQNSTTDRSSPVQVGALTNWSLVSAGSQFCMAVKTDGTLWTWGGSYNGKLGDNSSGFSSNKSSPIQVGALTNWYTVSASAQNPKAIKTDGTLWSWGDNSNGQIGDGTVVSRSSPVQIGLLTNWSQAVGNGKTTAAVKTSGTLETWGNNNEGALGINNGSVFNRSSPVQVGALTNWSKPSMGSNFCVVVKTDGTLWTWGRNASGQLGQNNRINRSSPVQVGALTSWSQSSAQGNGNTVLAIFTSRSN